MALANPRAWRINHADDQAVRTYFCAENLRERRDVRRIHIVLDVGGDAVERVATRRAVLRDRGAKSEVGWDVVKPGQSPADYIDASGVGDRQEAIRLGLAIESAARLTGLEINRVQAHLFGRGDDCARIRHLHQWHGQPHTFAVDRFVDWLAINDATRRIWRLKLETATEDPTGYSAARAAVPDRAIVVSFPGVHLEGRSTGKYVDDLAGNASPDIHLIVGDADRVEE